MLLLISAIQPTVFAEEPEASEELEGSVIIIGDEETAEPEEELQEAPEEEIMLMSSSGRWTMSMKTMGVFMYYNGTGYIEFSVGSKCPDPKGYCCFKDIPIHYLNSSGNSVVAFCVQPWLGSQVDDAYVESDGTSDWDNYPAGLKRAVAMTMYYGAPNLTIPTDIYSVDDGLYMDVIQAAATQVIIYELCAGLRDWTTFAYVQRKLSLALKSNVIRQANADTISMDYEEIRSAVESGMYIKSSLAAGEDLCYMSTILTIRAPDTERLQTAFLEMKEYCIRNDLMLKRLSFRQQAAYTSCYPCSGLSESIRSITRRNIMTSGLGSCYPFTAYELCERDGIFLGLNARYGSPVFLNSFNASAYQNANMLLVGPSGSGKTYTLLCMLLRMRQKGLQIFVIAPLKGFEFYRSANAVDGEIVVIAPGSKQNINVMEIRGGQTDEVEENRVENSLLSNKIQQLHRFFSLIIPDLTSLEKQVLDNALLQTYRSFGITEDNSSIYETDNTRRPKRMPILGDLQDQLKKEGEAAERLVLLLSRFVSGSASSFNRQTNVDLSNRFVVCDCSHLTPELLPAGMFICLDYIMDRAKQSRTEKKVIAVDEMWKLMTASELSAEFVVEVFRVIRGYAGAAIGATQDIQDVMSDRSGAAIFNNSKIKLLLPMGKKEIDSIRGVMDLTQAEAENLKRPETGSDASGKRKPTKLLMAANSNHIFITVKASRMEHDLITTNSEDLIRIKQMRREEESNAV